MSTFVAKRQRSSLVVTICQGMSINDSRGFRRILLYTPSGHDDTLDQCDTI